MTTLANILTDLSHGVLSNLHVGNSGDGSISEKHLPKIMVFINDGLTKLYGKFALRRKSILVSVLAGDTETTLSTVAPDFLKVIGVEKLGTDGAYFQVPLNDSTTIAESGVFTPAIGILQVPASTDLSSYKVHYQARHPTVAVGDLGSKDIELPEILYEALTFYVAYRAYMGVNTQEAIASAGAYLGQYKIACDEAAAMDTVAQSQSHTNTRFQNNGWS